jgi:hypothetical protein
MDIPGILAELQAQRDRIDAAITALELLNGSASAPKTPKSTSKVAVPSTVKSTKTAPVPPLGAKKRVISAEARQRMAEAQQKRWAKKKRAMKAAANKATAAPTAAKKATTDTSKA